jgi:hypothetical protein
MLLNMQLREGARYKRKNGGISEANNQASIDALERLAQPAIEM